MPTTFAPWPPRRCDTRSQHKRRNRQPRTTLNPRRTINGYSPPPNESKESHDLAAVKARQHGNGPPATNCCRHHLRSSERHCVRREKSRRPEVRTCRGRQRKRPRSPTAPPGCTCSHRLCSRVIDRAGNEPPPTACSWNRVESRSAAPRGQQFRSRRLHLGVMFTPDRTGRRPTTGRVAARRQDRPANGRGGLHRPVVQDERASMCAPAGIAPRTGEGTRARRASSCVARVVGRV